MPASEYENHDVSTSDGKQAAADSNAKNEILFVGHDGIEFRDDMTVEEGVYEAVPFEDYKAINAINNSSLHHAARSQKHFRHYINHRRETESPALRFGTLAHAGVLEPERLLEMYVVLPDFTEGIDSPRPKATKEYKEKVREFDSKHKGLQVITPAEYQQMLGVVEAVHGDQRSRAAFQNGKSEVTLVWSDPILGRLCKARPDYLNGGANSLCDLKTTRDARDFERSIANYGYDRQAAFYLRGAQILGYDLEEFWFVAVESEPPHGVRTAPLDKETLEDGRKQVEHLLKQVAAADVTGVDVGYEHPDTFRKPPWSMKFKTAAEPREMRIGGRLVTI